MKFVASRQEQSQKTKMQLFEMYIRAQNDDSVTCNHALCNQVQSTKAVA